MEANKQDHRTSSPLIAVALPHVSSQPPSSQTDNEAQGPTLCMRHDFRIFSNTRCRQITGRSSSLMFIVRCALDFLLHSSSARCLCFRFLNTTYIYIYNIYPKSWHWSVSLPKASSTSSSSPLCVSDLCGAGAGVHSVVSRAGVEAKLRHR